MPKDKAKQRSPDSFAINKTSTAGAKLISSFSILQIEWYC